VLGGGAPVYQREYKEPAYYQEYKKFDINSINPPADSTEYKKALRFLLSHPNIASRSWILEQYDSMVGTANASTNSPADAAVVMVKPPQGGKAEKAIVIAVNCNGRYVHADPEIGCAIAVCESARNVICAGGDPVAITNNLNFGNPYHPEVYWQFVGSIQGMIKACNKLGTPVTGGNVSFYNQSSSASKKEGDVSNAVFPTPTIGMLGLMEDLDNKMTLDFKAEGDLIYLIGEAKEDLASSEYLYSYLGIKASPAPAFDLDEEYKLQVTLKGLIKNRLLQSLHDVSNGGLLVTLIESALPQKRGFEIKSFPNVRKDAYLFGENQSRAVVSIRPEQKENFEDFMEQADYAYAAIGIVKGQEVVVDAESWIRLEEAAELYQHSLSKLIER
ncbi:MAG: AIR synthase related protein, partial [Bacteroidota bacterium]